MSELVIRQATRGDRGKIEALLNEAKEFRADEAQCAVELLDESFRGEARDEDYASLCAEAPGGKIIGYVNYGKTPLTRATWDLYWIVIDPARRRSGVGRKMLRRLEEVLKEKGATLLVAETSSLPAYAQARAFYEKEGFREESRIRDFYGAGDDRLIYCKRFSY